jgi:hypothetical protein
LKVDFGPIQNIHEVEWYGNEAAVSDKRKEDILAAISALSQYIMRTGISMGCFYSASLTMMVEFGRAAMEEKNDPGLLDDTIKDLEAIADQLKRERAEVAQIIKAKENGNNESECVHPINHSA